MPSPHFSPKLFGFLRRLKKNNDPDFAHNCFAQVAGIVLLTSVVNGWSAGAVVTSSGMAASLLSRTRTAAPR